MRARIIARTRADAVVAAACVIGGRLRIAVSTIAVIAARARGTRGFQIRGARASTHVVASASGALSTSGARSACRQNRAETTRARSRRALRSNAAARPTSITRAVHHAQSVTALAADTLGA